MVDEDREAAEQQKLSNMEAQNMMDSMKWNIKRLEKSVHQLKADLRDKNVDMDNLESVTNEMDLRELDLTRGLQNVRSIIQHQAEALDGKKARISHLKEQIAILEAELVHEESTLEPMERSILVLEQKALDKEQKIFGHRAERKSFSVMKQNLIEERDSLNRELQNSHSELKSLKAIQDLTLGHDSF
jgi:chromosome segregation ATPase